MDKVKGRLKMNCGFCIYNNTKHCICPCMGESVEKGRRWRNKLKAMNIMI